MLSFRTDVLSSLTWREELRLAAEAIGAAIAALDRGETLAPTITLAPNWGEISTDCSWRGLKKGRDINYVRTAELFTNGCGDIREEWPDLRSFLAQFKVEISHLHDSLGVIEGVDIDELLGSKELRNLRQFLAAEMPRHADKTAWENCRKDAAMLSEIADDRVVVRISSENPLTEGNMWAGVNLRTLSPSIVEGIALDNWPYFRGNLSYFKEAAMVLRPLGREGLYLDFYGVVVEVDDEIGSPGSWLELVRDLLQKIAALRAEARRARRTAKRGGTIRAFMEERQEFPLYPAFTGQPGVYYAESDGPRFRVKIITTFAGNGMGVVMSRKGGKEVHFNLLPFVPEGQGLAQWCAKAGVYALERAHTVAGAGPRGFVLVRCANGGWEQLIRAGIGEMWKFLRKLRKGADNFRIQFGLPINTAVRVVGRVLAAVELYSNHAGDVEFARAADTILAEAQELPGVTDACKEFLDDIRSNLTVRQHVPVRDLPPAATIMRRRSARDR